MTKISLIIPAYDEEDYLPDLLNSVDYARRRYRKGFDNVQVVLSDNGSTDRTRDVAGGYGCTVVQERRRIIGAVRNTGAEAATGDFFVFTDADNTIHPDTFNGIDEALSHPAVIAGSTGVHLERMSPPIALTLAVLMPMIWITGMDTGVVFCRREDFFRIGGYREDWLFGEDVQFLWDLKKLGWKRKQRLVRLRRYKAITSTRKFDQHGEWHYFGHILRFFSVVLFPKRYSIDDFARRYWYPEERSRRKK